MLRSRRVFCVGLASAIAVNGGAQAQKSRAALRKRIGLLDASGIGLLDSSGMAELVAQLGALGSQSGQEVDVVVRIGDPSVDPYDLALQLVNERVDLIVATGTPYTLAAHDATSSIPIVFAVAGDPIKYGLASTLAKPGGNATGVYTLSTETVGKRMELLCRLAPKIRRVGILRSPDESDVEEVFTASRAATGMKVEPVLMSISRESDARSVISSQRVDALCLLIAPPIRASIGRIVDFAIARRLPTVSAYAGFAERGGLADYAADVPDLVRRLLALASKVLMGAKPASIPIEQSQRFVMTLNMATARQIGLEIPAEARILADRVIG